MKRCDYCGHENTQGALTCAGCGKKLDPPSVSGVDSTLKDHALAPVVLKTFTDPMEANALVTRLQAAGIDAYMPQDGSTNVFSGILPFERVTVQVPLKDFEAARKLAESLAGLESSESADEIPGPESGTGSGLQDQLELPALDVPNRTRCVSCGAAVPYDSILCPECGWTQPRPA
jgi:putative signal transducing protein